MSDREMKLSVVLNAVDRMTAPLRTAMGASKGAAAEWKKASSELAKLNKVQEQLDRYQNKGKQVGQLGNMAKAAGMDWQDALARNRALGSAATKKQIKEVEDLKDKYGTISAQLQNAERSYLRQQELLKAQKLPLKNIGDYQEKLALDIANANGKLVERRKLLDDENARQRRLNEYYQKAANLRSTQGKIAGAGIGMMAAGAAVTAATMLPVKAYAEAEDAATQLKVAMMQSGGQVSSTFEQINTLANTLGNRLPGTTADYQNMMTMLVRQGMSAQAILGGLGEATAYLAVQLQMPTTAAAEFASKLQDATKTSEKDMMALMDTIQRTFYLGVDSNNMLQAYAKFSSAMGMLRMSGAAAADAMAPLIVMADQQSLVGESAGNAFRKVFQYAISLKRVKDANAELSGTGIKLNFADKNGNFAGIDNMLKQLEKLKGLGDQKKGTVLKELFGDDAETLQAVHMMIDKGRAGYAETQAKMAAQADIQRRVNEQLGTLKNLWDAATGTFTNALATFGASIAPELHATAKWLADVAGGIQNWAQNNPALAGTLMTIAKYLGLFLTVGGGLALVIAGLLGPLALMTTAAGALGLSLWPILLVVGAIAALGVAAIALIKNWEGIKEYFSTLFTDVGSNIINGLWNGISNGWQWLREKVYGIAGSIANTVKEALGIRSPSRVFAELGGYTMEGFGMGLTDGQQATVATMRLVMAGVAAAGSVALSPAALASGGMAPIQAGGQGAAVYQGSTIQITVNPAPGMDEAALADLVARKIEELERRRSAGTRSSLRDRD